MNRSHDNEDLDYEPDIQKLKQVWEEVKNPPKKNYRTIESKPDQPTNAHLKETKAKEKKKGVNPQNQKKKKIIISEQNVTRNPKQDPSAVIEIVTKPEAFHKNPMQNQKNNVAQSHLILAQPSSIVVGEVQSLKKALEEKDYELSLLRVTNTHNEDRVRRLQKQIEDKERLIEELRDRERELVAQASSYMSKEFNFNYGKVEYQNYRNDSRRLLKMLRSTSEYQKFAEFALEDDGVRFLTNVSKNVKTRLDAPTQSQTHFHFCTCNKEFIPEASLWVPDKAYDFGKQFIKERINQVMTQAELQLLLYELNRIWRQREKKIVNSCNALKANQIGKYKRKMKEIERGGQVQSSKERMRQ